MSLIKNPISNLKILFFISIAALTGLFAFSYAQNKQLIQKALLVNHTTVLKNELGNALSYFKDAETGIRGFIITKDSSFLQPYYSALRNIPRSLNNLDALIGNNAKQRVSLEKLMRLSAERMFIINKIKNAQQNADSIIQLMNEGKKAMDQLRLQTALMIYEEEKLLNTRTASLNKVAAFVPQLLILLASLAILLLIISYLKILKELKNSIGLQQSLATANKILEQSNKELAQFAYIASHDLQEPLRKIQTFISLIEQNEYSALSERGKDYFGRITKSAKRMQQLIVDILSYSGIDKDKNKKEKLGLNEVITAASFFLELSIKEKQAVITTAKLPDVYAVKYQMEQVFTNLISNALKFSVPGRPPVINITSAKIMGENIVSLGANANSNYHQVIIEDNGIGFDAKHQHKIFDIFNRLNTKEEFEGNGIGLSIVKKIMENSAGFVHASSEKGKGAKFALYFPA